MRAEAWIALVFAVAAAAAGLSGALPDDEGQLTYLGAVIVVRAPLAGLFFQKIHPSISAISAPFAAMGFRAFLLGHAALAGAAVYLLGASARRIVGERAWLASLLLAASPMFFLSAATGQSNSTATLFFAAALALLDGSPRARVIAGVIAGAGLWSRYEQAPYLLGLVAYDVLRNRRWQVAAGALGFVALYVLAGAAYHGSALWLFTRPPVLLRETAPTTMTELALDRAQLGSLLSGLCLVSPLFLSPLLLSRAALAAPVVRLLAAVFGLSLAVQLALPQLGRLFNYDYTARYFVCHLPALAVLAAVVAKEPGAAPRRAVALALTGIALALWIPRGLHILPLAFLCVLPGVAWPPRRADVATAGGAVLAAALALWVDGRRHTSALPQEGLDAAAAYVARAPGEVTVYTNAHQLQAMAERAGLRRRVRFLVGYDMVIELAAELGARPTRQSAEIFRAITPHLYGEALWPCACPHSVPGGSLLVLARSERAAQVYDLRRWTDGSERVLARGEVTVRRARGPLDLPCMQRPPWLDADTVNLPCAAP